MKFPQTENEPLDIHDTNRSTEGGPPGWLAFSTVMLFYLPSAILFLLLFVWLSTFAT